MSGDPSLIATPMALVAVNSPSIAEWARVCERPVRVSDGVWQFRGAVAIFWLIDRGTDTTHRWGVVSAIGIAFSLAIVTTFASRLPPWVDAVMAFAAMNAVFGTARDRSRLYRVDR